MRTPEWEANPDSDRLLNPKGDQVDRRNVGRDGKRRVRERERERKRGVYNKPST